MDRVKPYAGRLNFHETVSPLQARVLFHSERLFRSAGASRATDRARGEWIRAVQALGLDPAAVPRWSDAQCTEALRLLEACARSAGVAYFRDVRVS